MRNFARSKLIYDVNCYTWPIVYHEDYPFTLFGLEKKYSFDLKKSNHIVEFLINSGMIADKTCIAKAREALFTDLILVHGKKYLHSLNWSYNVACIAEFFLIALIPNCILQRVFLRPMRLQTGGSVLAAKLAMERGWGINIGGGFHHACCSAGGGYSVYSDVALVVRLMQDYKYINTAMIIDLGAHQGNGYERDFMHTKDVYIFDMYNSKVYPQDNIAKRAISRKVELRAFTEDREYMFKLRRNLPMAFKEFYPDLVIYNAGTDVLEGDPFGRLCLSMQCVVERDELVFELSRSLCIPIVMLTGSGYQKLTPKVIAMSICNLYKKGLIGMVESSVCMQC